MVVEALRVRMGLVTFSRLRCEGGRAPLNEGLPGFIKPRRLGEVRQLPCAFWFFCVEAEVRW